VNKRSQARGERPGGDEIIVLWYPQSDISGVKTGRGEIGLTIRGISGENHIGRKADDEKTSGRDP